MAKVISAKTGKAVEIPDGARIKEAAEKLGVPFSCTEGICGTCITEILDGEKNLCGLNEREKDLGMDEKTRLMCQCKVNGGSVKIGV